MAKLDLNTLIGGGGIYKLSIELRFSLNSQGFKTMRDYGEVGQTWAGNWRWVTTTFLGLDYHLKEEWICFTICINQLGNILQNMDDSLVLS